MGLLSLLAATTLALPPELQNEVARAPSSDEAADRILAYYDARGYPAVDVTVEETFAGYEPTVLILPVGNLSASGGSAWQNRAATRYFAPLVGEPLHLPTLQSALARYHRNPFHAVAPEMAPTEAFDAVDVDLVLSPSEQTRFSVAVDNFSADSLPDERVSFTANFADVGGFAGTTELSFLSALDPREFYALIAQQEWMAYDGSATRLVLAYSGIEDNSITGDTEAWSFGATVERRFAPTSSGTNFLRANFRRSNNSLEFGQNSLGGLTSVVQFTIGRDFTWTDGAATIALNAGPDLGLADSSGSDYARLREGASVEFLQLRGSANQRWTFENESSFSLKANAQLSSRPTLQAEQLNLGSLSGVRSLQNFELLADSGLVLQSEYALPTWRGGETFALRPSAFLDYGIARDQVANATDHEAAVGVALQARWHDAELAASFGQSLLSSSRQLHLGLRYRF